jgi:hypothetical protein
MDVDDHRLHGGQSWPIDYRLGFFSSTTVATCTAAYRQSLGRRDGNARADASRSRGNGGTRRCGSDDDKASAGNDRAGASRRSGRFGVEANTHFVPGPRDQIDVPVQTVDRSTTSVNPETGKAFLLVVKLDHAVSVLGSTGHRRFNWRLGEVASFRPPAGLLEDLIPPDLLLDWKRLEDGLPRQPLD